MRHCFRTLAVLLIALCCYPILDAQSPTRPQPQWIWLSDKPGATQEVCFRKEVVLKSRITSAKLYGACDNSMIVYINGKEAVRSDNWESPVFREVSDLFNSPKGKAQTEGRNVIAVKAKNAGSAAGLLLRIVFESPKRDGTMIVTDSSWRATEKPAKGWEQVGFDDSKWTPAVAVANLGAGPWQKITEASLQGTAKYKTPTATPVELIKAKKDFKVELVYSVPKETQGSWVSMCMDDKGRLITSDQYGKLYRITLPPPGAPEKIKVDELPVDLGEAQGLLWAFDSLYVVVNRGKKYESGLWRVTSSKKNDVLDTKEKLRELQGGGEHGPHAVILSPDGKSLYVVAGNHTKLTKLSGSKVPTIWGEDFLVPRLWDASGHAVGILAPGGVIYKVDPSGRNWELISVGYRNQYDIAFNRHGELFTYDSDMEWDMSLPWYKPTRVCHAVDGSELGWRSGTSNFPASYPDSLPNVVDVGPGSPTGISFGYGAKFPLKYQEALYLCDWSYGKLYAVHMKEDGSSYTGELEEFMNGSPLPLTDILINPKDGAMYFTIGGRNTMSGLYRVTYTGSESTAQPGKGEPKSANAAQRAVRKKLESYYAKKDPAAIDVAWPYLSSKDRFLRYAARTILEFQEPSLWQDKALKETNPIAAIHALLGLVRVGDKVLLPKVLESLERIAWAKLDPAQKIDYLRTYQLAFIRMGDPDAAWKDRVAKRIDGFYPAELRETNSELCKLLSHLESPSGVTKTLALMAKAPSQEEQIDYALSLRTVKTGFTPAQREEYLNWFHKAAGFRGGHSFHGFLKNIRADAVKSLSDSERMSLKAAIENVPVPAQPKFTFKERPFVKKYSLDELLPVVEGGLKGRNYDRGRNLFGEAKCFTCHRFANEGGGTGPDLTSLQGRFGARDLLESIITPSKVISDQYQAIVISTTDGRQISGRIVNLQGDNISVNVDMLDPNKIVGVNRKLVESIEPSRVSMMPEGLFDTLQRDEVLDLMAYLLSRGDRNHAMFSPAVVSVGEKKPPEKKPAVPEKKPPVVEKKPATPEKKPAEAEKKADVREKQAVAPGPRVTTASGFIPLFNGRDLTNWQGLVPINKRAKLSPDELKKAQEEANAKYLPHWTVKQETKTFSVINRPRLLHWRHPYRLISTTEGILEYDGKGQSLQTVKDYGNFELLVDWKIGPKGDSGIYLRGNPQVQIWDGGLKKEGSGGLFNNKIHSSKPLVNADRPAGEWNTFWIRMVGDKVTIKLNGTLVVDNVPLENYWERGQPLPARGPIELQHHGDHLWFKNVYIRELPD